MSTQFGPYSPVKQAGNLYFVSGQVGVHPVTKTAPSDIRAQTRQVLDNLAAVLKTANLDLSHVVKTTLFLNNIDDFAAVNEIYVTYFPEPRPARSCVAIASLPRVAGDTELLIEIEAIAHKEDK